uniref:WW domain-containing protein n=1 Tax=Electrophorus electricus TaxID=8005 RepID=A0A4W4ENV6_ELEEL
MSTCHRRAHNLTPIHSRLASKLSSKLYRRLQPREAADYWSEHISSSGKKYYYNCKTEVSQWEKPKEWLEREQRQKEASKAVVVNSFPKDRDYRQEAMQATAANSTAVLSKFRQAGPQFLSSTRHKNGLQSQRLCNRGSQKPLGPCGGFFSAGHFFPFASPPEPAAADKPSSHSDFSQASSSVAGGPNTSSTSTLSTPTPALQSNASALLQDPTLLRQLLPALQATLQINSSSVDMAKSNEALTAAVTQASLQSVLHKLLAAGPSAFNVTTLLSHAAQLTTQVQQSGQSPMSATPDASSPRSYVSPRVSTPQTNNVPKPLHNASSLPTQPKVSESVMKSGSSLQSPSGTMEKSQELDDPRLHRQNSQGPPSSGPNGCLANDIASATVCPPTTFTPSLALHFDENLVRHVQSWPSDHVEKQASRLREEVHNLGSINMSEICTELKKLRSLVRVCEIQATLREQRVLFLRQQIKELEKLKNQNSFMV